MGNMIIKGIITEDFVNYKLPSLTIEFPYCDFKCDKECGQQVCQNSPLLKEPDINIDAEHLINEYYLNNEITKAIVMQGLEPFNSFFQMLQFIYRLRVIHSCDDDIVIYTGYKEDEIKTKVDILSKYKNIIIKFGRYIPEQESHYDEVLGVSLASPNQYAKKIS